jgi:hypothetical protein
LRTKEDDIRRSFRLSCGLNVVMHGKRRRSGLAPRYYWLWTEWFEARVWSGRRIVGGVFVDPMPRPFPKGIIQIESLDGSPKMFMMAVKRVVAHVHAQRFAGLS